MTPPYVSFSLLGCLYSSLNVIFLFQIHEAFERRHADQAQAAAWRAVEEAEHHNQAQLTEENLRRRAEEEAREVLHFRHLSKFSR